MTEDQIVRSMRTGSLQLGAWDAVTYFLPALVTLPASFVLPAIWVFNAISGATQKASSRPFDPKNLLFIVVPLGLSLGIYALQRKALRMTRIETGLNAKEIMEAAFEVAKQEEWFISEARANALVARSGGSFWSWGERITVISRDSEAWINSICDPDAPMSLVGRNKANIRALTNKLAE